MRAIVATAASGKLAKTPIVGMLIGAIAPVQTLTFVRVAKKALPSRPEATPVSV
jgi:hypothetical protein